MADYAPVKPGEVLTYTAGAAITGGQLLAFTAADTVQPTSGPTLAVAGVAGHDAATGQPVTVYAGSGVVHDTLTPAGLPAPAQPVPTTAPAGGTVADGTYQVRVTYVNAAGESLASTAGSVTAAGGGTSTLTIPSPRRQPGATGWFGYCTQAGGATFTRQQAPGSPTAIGTPLVLTAPPTSGGAAPPAANTTTPAPGQLVAAAASGQITAGAAAGAELGVAIRPPTPGGHVRWKVTRG